LTFAVEENQDATVHIINASFDVKMATVF